MNKKDLKYGVGVLVVKDGRFLCGIRSDTGEISGPGGHIEKGETPEQAAIRETKEEFGITPTDLKRVGCIKSPDNLYLPTMVFVCTKWSGQPKAGAEMAEGHVSFEDMRELDKDDAVLYPAFDDAVNLLISAITRKDGGPGSGNWGHAGRPGQRGGSGKGGGKAGASAGSGARSKSKKGSNKSALGNKGTHSLKNGYGRSDAKDCVSENKDNSAKKHLDENGEFTKERDQLHMDIIDNIFLDNNDSNEDDRPKGKDGKPIGRATPVEGQAEFIMMGGGPATGKSSVIKAGQVDVPDNRVQIDPDRAKKGIPEYNQMVAEGKTDAAAGFAHEESSAIAKRAYQAAAENNYNVLYDGTGDGSVNSVRKKIQTARENGMSVKGVYCTCDIEEALRRADERGKKTGRVVKHETIRETHKKVSQILPEVAKDFDEVKLFDTGVPKGTDPILIATGGNGKGLTPVKGREARFQAFLDKANAD